MEYETPPEYVRPNVLLYGPPKTYKTGGASTAPGKILYLNTDTPNAVRIAQANARGRIAFPKWEGFKTLVEIQQMVHSDRAPDVVVFDTVADLHRLLMEQGSDRAIRPDIRIYGDVGVHLERFCRDLCKAPNTSLILVCHELTTRNEATGEIETLPYTGTDKPKLANKLMGMVDIVGFTGLVETEEGPEYHASFRSSKGRRGGDRFKGVLGSHRKLDLAEWFDTIRQAEAMDAPEAQEAAAA